MAYKFTFENKLDIEMGGGNNVDGPFVDYRGALTSTFFFIKKCPNDDRGA